MTKQHYGDERETSIELTQIRIRASFGWSDDDEEFVSHLVHELRGVASEVRHRRGRFLTEARHHLELQASPANAEGCVGLLAGLAEAGAWVMMELGPAQGDEPRHLERVADSFDGREPQAMPMTKNEIALRALAAGIFSGKMVRVDGLKVVQAYVDAEGAPPRVRVECEGFAVEIAVLSAERLDEPAGGQEPA